MLKRILFLAGLALVSTAAIYPAPPILKRAELGFAVSSNAALQTYKSTDFTSLTRLGFYASDDSPRVIFTSTNAACTLNSGAGDNGTQVKLADGNCAVANLPSTGYLTPTIWGAKGDGAANDTVALQAAFNGASAAGRTLNFDAAHLFVITSTLNITAPLHIEGPYRYGIWPFNQATGTGTQSCPWGIVTKDTGIDIINAAAVTGVIHNLCIDATGDGTVNPASGYAIRLAPPSTTTYSSGWSITDNSILDPYVGIGVPGNGPGAACCGIGTSADGDVISRNTILSPTQAAIEIGKNSAAAAGGPGTVGITVEDNDIVCKTTTSQASGIGVAVYEGAIWYDGTQNGPEGCHIGTLIKPGTLGGVGQFVSFNGDGVFGDQSASYNLLVQPQTGGMVFPLMIGGKGPWANSTANTGNFLIDATAGGTIEEVTINGIYASAGGGATFPALDIEGSANGPFDLNVSNSLFCGQGSATGTTALKLNAGSGSTGRWTIEGNHIGTGCLAGRTVDTGIALTINAGSTSHGSVTIVGNDISTPTTPIAYTPSGSDNVVIANNQGIETGSVPNVATAASVTLPGAWSLYNMTGTTATTLTGGWNWRPIKLIAPSGFTLSNACFAADAIPAGATHGYVWDQPGTCWLHVN